MTPALKSEAKEYKISPNKMSFIEKIVDIRPNLDLKMLSQLSIKELISLIEESELKLEDLVETQGFIQHKGNTGKSLGQSSEGFPERDKSSLITVERAKEIALKLIEGGKIVKVEFEQDDNEAEYEIEIIWDNLKHEIEIDAYTGKVKEHKTKKINSADNKPEIKNSEKEILLAEEARNIALKVAGGGRVIDIELEIEGDKAEYEVEIIKDNEKHEVEIDAYTGEILDHEIETIKKIE